MESLHSSSLSVPRGAFAWCAYTVLAHCTVQHTSLFTAAACRCKTSRALTTMWSSVHRCGYGNLTSFGTNKVNFITMLKSKLEAKGIKVKQAVEDANIMTVETAFSAADKYDSVIITGEDIDFLMIFTALGSSKKNVYLYRSEKSNSPTLLYSAHSFMYNPQDILFLHATNVCNTTSAPFGIGKNKVMQMYSKNPSLSKILATFKDPKATHTQITDVGEKFLVKLCEGTIELDNIEDQTKIYHLEMRPSTTYSVRTCTTGVDGKPMLPSEIAFWKLTK